MARAPVAALGQKEESARRVQVPETSCSKFLTRFSLVPVTPALVSFSGGSQISLLFVRRDPPWGGRRESESAKPVEIFEGWDL